MVTVDGLKMGSDWIWVGPKPTRCLSKKMRVTEENAGAKKAQPLGAHLKNQDPSQAGRQALGKMHPAAVSSSLWPQGAHNSMLP